MVEQQSGHPLTGLDFTVKALLNGRWDADVTEAMASSKSHLGSVGHIGTGVIFFGLEFLWKGAVSPQPGQKGTTEKRRRHRTESENLGHVRGCGDFPKSLLKGSQDLCSCLTACRPHSAQWKHPASKAEKVELHTRVSMEFPSRHAQFHHA